ncbi:hypothetical protein GGI20_003617 [Coemansia sp. BCRC 34301]|nr:hypothetical protein GGI20_003617 [Coemansia sp. BCRC 34301]
MNILAIAVLAFVVLAQLTCGIPVNTPPSGSSPPSAGSFDIGALVSYLAAGFKGNGANGALPPAKIDEYRRYFQQLWSAMKRPDDGNRHGHNDQNRPNKPGKPNKPSDLPAPPANLPTIVAPKVPIDGISSYTQTPFFTTYDASELLTKVFPDAV